MLYLQRIFVELEVAGTIATENKTRQSQKWSFWQQGPYGVLGGGIGSHSSSVAAAAAAATYGGNPDDAAQTFFFDKDFFLLVHQPKCLHCCLP